MLYAKWIANTYNVSYDLNDALSTAPLAQTKTHDVTLKLSDSTPEREGYTFKGWNPVVEEKVTKGVIYTATWIKDVNKNDVEDTEGIEDAEVLENEEEEETDDSDL